MTQEPRRHAGSRSPSHQVRSDLPFALEVDGAIWIPPGASELLSSI